MNLLTKIRAVLVMALIIGVSVACKSKQSELTRINVAYFPNITHAQALLMKGQGALERAYGSTVKVNWIAFNAGPSEIQALFAGDVDIGYIGPVPAITGYIQSNGDLRIIAGATDGGSVLVARNGESIQSPKDLAGKTVAVPQIGNTQHLSLLALLSANGLAPSASGGNVNVIAANNADIVNLMNQNNIDAALLPEPWGSILEKNQNAKIVLDYDQVDPNGIPSTAVVIVRKDFMDAYPEAAARFIQAHKEATGYINSGAADAMKVINAQITEATQKPIAEDILASAFKRLRVTYEIPAASITAFANTCLEQKIVPNLPDSNLIDDTYIK